MGQGTTKVGLGAVAVAVAATLIRLAFERPVADAHGYAVKQVLVASVVYGLVAVKALAIVVFVARRQGPWVWAALAASVPVALASLAPGVRTSLLVVTDLPWPILALDAAESLAFVAWVTAALVFFASQLWIPKVGTDEAGRGNP